jgi:hypothetical protein
VSAFGELVTLVWTTVVCLFFAVSATALLPSNQFMVADGTRGVNNSPAGTRPLFIVLLERWRFDFDEEPSDAQRITI